MKLLIFCLLAVYLAQCQELHSLLDLCLNPPSTPTSISDKILPEDVYKISGSISDYIKATTALLVESSDKDYRVLERILQDKTKERWIQELKGNQKHFYVNATGGSCIGNAPKPQLISNPNFLSIIGNDTSSYFSIIQGFINSAKAHQGFLINGSQEIIGGLITNKWVSCQKSGNSSFVMEVRYSGDKSIAPVFSSNPMIFSIRLVELADFNSTTPIAHISIEMDRYDRPVGNEAIIEHGIYCTNGNSTIELPLNPISEFSGVLNYFDHATNKSQSLNVLYSKSQNIFSFSGEKNFESGVSLVKAPPSYFRNRTNYVLHDFKHGYEFTMSDDSCTSFSALSAANYDVLNVLKDNKTFVTLKPFEFIIVDLTLRFDEYQSEVNWLGRKIRNFRGYHVTEETIHEVKIDAETLEIIEIAVFHQGTRHLGITVTVQRTSEITVDLERLSNCYENGQYSNNTWAMDLKNKNVTDLKNVGLAALNEAVVESITKNVAPVIPYRILVFWTQTADGGLQTMLRISDKTSVTPANTTSYNITTELATEDLWKLVNQTIYDEKLPLEILKNDGTKEEWVFNSKSITLYPLPNNNSSDFLGYTGGAMFVLAIFCLLIGVSIGAAGVFVATRRQRISTLAYQVFE